MKAMEKKKAWVWFKGGKSGGSWIAGFLASYHKEEEGVTIERSDFVSCRVPDWRIRYDEPRNEKEGPQIPKNPIWKYN